MSNPDTHAIDPARLERGRWCGRRQKTIGEGDISASYSADRIAYGEPVRKPFVWNSVPHVCVSFRPNGGGGSQARCYRLVHRAAFDGAALTYAAKTADSDAARADPNGFHHGMIVKHAGDEWVLSGPPLVFIPGEPDQLSLF